MPNSNDKFAALMGFARRAGKLKYGLDELKKARRIELYAVTTSASENLLSDMKALARRAEKPLVIAKTQSFTNDGNCKAIGVSDAHMAKGMLEYVEQTENYQLYRFTEER